MASDSYPRTGHNSGAVTDVEYEALAVQYSQDGLVGLPTDAVMAFGDSSGRQVKVRANRKALVRGHVYDSGGSDITLSIAANSSGSTRIDLVVLRLTRATGVVAEAIVQGTAGAGAPAITQATGTSGTYEIPLAQVTVINGASTIAAADVTPLAWYVSPSGRILCTSSTRPTGVPRRLGTIIKESDTGSVYEWDGTSAWRQLLDDTSGKGVRDITRIGGGTTIATIAPGPTQFWTRTITQGIESGRMYQLYFGASCANASIDYTAVRLQVAVNGTVLGKTGYRPLWKAGYPNYLDLWTPVVVATSSSLAIAITGEVQGGGSLAITGYDDEPFLIQIHDVRRNAAGISHT